MASLDDLLKNVSVLGAAGKMGSGIALVVLQEMAKTEALLMGKIGSGSYRLNLIDSDGKGLDNLRRYLFSQVKKFAEKNIISLRKWFEGNPQLVSNQEIIQAFIVGAMDLIHFDTQLAPAKESHLIFEAIIEDPDIKAEVFRSLETQGRNAYIFSNTSSIPIRILNENGELEGKICGFHFYNPPSIQKLVELIVPEETAQELKNYAQELVQRFGKIAVYSNDTAGFIGNGHFLREIGFALRKVKGLTQNWPLHEAIYVLNLITHDFLLRPMGIIQLLDYVGLDVALKISKVMKAYIPGLDFPEDLLQSMQEVGICGGQFPDGSQKNGFFQYGPEGITGVYSLEKNDYVLTQNSEWVTECKKEMGNTPDENLTWKKLQKNPISKEKLPDYFQKLFQQSSIGATLAQEFLIHSRETARNLVKDGVAQNVSDVNTVLESGFFHLYGADNPWLPQEEEARSDS